MSKTILLAEDDHNISEVMKIILEEAGYAVKKAKNKSEVMRILEETPPSLIFLDIRLGGDDGEDIAQELRSDERTAGIPLFLLSADTKTEIIAKRVGADGFLLKPFDLEDLITLVNTHITA